MHSCMRAILRVRVLTILRVRVAYVHFGVLNVCACMKSCVLARVRVFMLACVFIPALVRVCVFRRELG